VLDKLIQLVVEFATLFQLFAVLPQYAGGVVMRWGKFNRMAKPGFNWVWPFMVEHMLHINVVPETMPVGPQSLTTRDRKSVVISTIVTYSVEDVKKHLLEIEGAGQVIEDSIYGVVSKYVLNHTWEEMLAPETDMPSELSIAARRTAKRYGVNIITVQIADFTLSRSYRLMQPVHGHFAAIHH
jgi:regulator of protease activity HflC (stomatin/prohibitin superfamily)